MTALLASVRNLAEARLARAAGAGIIDLKDPGAGALGALPVAEAARIVAALGGGCPLSATVGDLPMAPGAVGPAVAAMAATGVDYVKIGFFPGGDWAAVIAGLEPLARDTRLVAVLFGDCAPQLDWLPALARAGFAGAMLDTADKGRGPLPRLCPPEFLRDFVRTARSLGLLCGLAGSLRAVDVPELLRLEPDYLGFRGALCRSGRGGELDPRALAALAAAMTTEA